MRRVRNRPLEAVTLILLATTLTACVAFAPLYARAMQGEATVQQLDRAPSLATSLVLTSTTTYDESDFTSAGPTSAPLRVDELMDVVPDRVRGYYGTPVAGQTANATVEHGAPNSTGTVISQPDQCRLVTITDGACPTAPGEILVSDTDRKIYGIRIGDRIRVTGERFQKVQPDGSSRAITTGVRLSVVGSYDAADWSERDDRWAGNRLGGWSGTTDPGPPPKRFHDAWIADENTFSENRTALLPAQASYVGLALRKSLVGPDEVALLAREIDRLRAELLTRTGSDISVESSISAIADDLEAQAETARVTVPLLMAQLALLALVVLWLALRAAAEERRPEVALVRLRGGGRRGARRFVVRELLPLVLAGVPPGGVLAILGCSLSRWWLMDGDLGVPELDLRLLLAVGLAALLLSAAVMVVAHRFGREPVAQLFRRVPLRRPLWRVGVLAAVSVAAATSALIAIILGDATGSVALGVPVLLSVVVGILLAHLTGPVSALFGRRVLRRGRLVGAIALLDAARSGTAARTVAMVTVAAAAAAFSTNAYAVAERNWSAAAAHRAGAAVVVSAEGGTVAQLRAVATDADAGGDHATPVARIKSPGTDAPQVLAVDPESFARVALHPGGEPSPDVWTALGVGDAEPLRVTGRRARIRVIADGLEARQPDGHRTPVDLSLHVQDESGAWETRVAQGLPGDTTVRAAFAMSCEDGCTVTGIRLRTVPGSSIRGQLSLDRFSVDGNAIRLDPRGGWRPVDTPEVTVTSTADDGTVGFDIRTSGASITDLSTTWLPTTVPVVATEARAEVTQDVIDTAPGLDGLSVPTEVAGTVAHVPASNDRTLLANLEALERIAPGRPDAAMEIWLDSPSLVTTVEQSLSDHGLVITDVRRQSALDRELRGTTAAWSLRLALVVGVLGLLLAAMVLIVVAAAGWRAGTRDLAALRLSGVSARGVRRMAVAAQLPAVLVGVAAGTVTGVVAARIALPIVPFFATDPEVSLLDLSTAWWAVVPAAVVALFVLAGTGALIGVNLSHRSGVDRVREAV
ncbi:hypothetical protein ASG90_07560 [Nocardioides sp. Soil797]|nr:hypothetical protein ASG90_07560 [Nocardioides sp. Soil797]